MRLVALLLFLFDTTVWDTNWAPIMGIICLPRTTLMYFVWFLHHSPTDPSGWWVVGIVAMVLMDIFSHGGDDD